jgi:hypothetical protein
MFNDKNGGNIECLGFYEKEILKPKKCVSWGREIEREQETHIYRYCNFERMLDPEF